jgi:putative inorganic carbon (hco3(-)) transporter
MSVGTEELLARIPTLLSIVEKASSELAGTPASDGESRARIIQTIRNKPLELSLIQKELKNRKAPIPAELRAQIDSIQQITAQILATEPPVTALPVAVTRGRSLRPVDGILQENTGLAIQRSWLVFILAGILVILAASVSIGFGGMDLAKYAIAGVLGIYVTVLIFLYPEVGAYIILLTTISSLSDIFTSRGLPSINQPLVLVVFACILINQVLQTGRVSFYFKPSRVELALLVFYLVVVASIFVANDNASAMVLFEDYTKNLVLVYCIFTTLNTPQKVKTGIWIAIGVAGLLASFGAIQFATGTSFTFGGLAVPSTIGQLNDQSVLRYSGPIGDANIWPQILSAVLPLAVYRIFFEKSPLTKLLALMASGLIFIAIFYTYSRGAFVTVVFILFLITIERKVSLPSYIFIMAGGLLVLSFLPQTYIERITSVTKVFDSVGQSSNVTDESFAGRLNEMKVGLNMFTTHPILGVGIGNYTTEYWNYAPQLGLESSLQTRVESSISRQAHNLFVELLSETGLLGLISFAFFMFNLFTSLWKKRSVYGPAFDSSFVVSIVMSILAYLFSGLFLHGVLYRWFWIFIAFGLAALHLPNDIADRYHSSDKPH